MTKSLQASQQKTSGSLNEHTPSNTWSDVSAPWTKPTLKKNPDLLLATRREIKSQINSLNTQLKRSDAELMDLHEQGELASYVDENNSNKYNGPGLSITLCQSKPKRTWDPEVQEQLDGLQKQIKRIEQIAERMEQYTEEPGRRYWMTKIETDQEL